MNKITITKLSCTWFPQVVEYNKVFQDVASEINSTYEDSFEFIELDSSRDSESFESLVSEHCIEGIPCLIIEEEGKDTIYLDGCHSEVELKEFILNLIGIKPKYLATGKCKYLVLKPGIYNVIWNGNTVKLTDSKNNTTVEVELDRNSPSEMYPCKMEVYSNGNVKILK